MKFVDNLWIILCFIYKHPMNSNNKFRAIGKFILWQIGMRLINKKVIVPWIDDSQFITARGETGLTGNLYCGFMEFEDMGFILHALRPEHKFIDVGANVGAYTILASSVVGAETIAFEPIPETVVRLESQVKLNNIDDKVRIEKMGLGDKKGLLNFTNDLNTMNKVVHSGINKDQITSVEVITLDEYITDNNPIFLKIDVEGYEYKVIQGSKNVLSSNKVIALIVELNNSGDEFGFSNEETHNLIMSMDFVPIAYDPILRKLTKLTSYNRNSGNTIYVKNLLKIELLCIGAEKRIVHTAFKNYI